MRTGGWGILCAVLLLAACDTPVSPVDREQAQANRASWMGQGR